MLHSTCQARILNSFIVVIFEKIAVGTASLACLPRSPLESNILQHLISRLSLQEVQKRGLKHHQRMTIKRLMMARIVSRKVKTVEAEMATESAVFTATYVYMLACALDAQCFAMPSLSPFNPYLSCCICTIRAVVTCSLHLPCCFVHGPWHHLGICVACMLYCLLWGASFCCLAIVVFHWS